MPSFEQLQKGGAAAIVGLTIPIALINWLGGIVSGVWLIALGDWGAILQGIFYFVIFSFAISFALLPAMIFIGPAAIALERGKKIIGVLSGSLGLLYIIALITAWCVWIMQSFTVSATEESLIPRLIWSYGVALGPWMRLAQKEQQRGSDGVEPSTITTFFAQVSYLVGIVMFLFGATIGNIAIVFGAIVVVGTAAQAVIVLSGKAR